jgi:ferredoxin
MPITKVWIEEGCTACGLCEEIAPEIFELGDRDEAIVKPDANFEAYEDEIKEAAESCPVEVIQIQES